MTSTSAESQPFEYAAWAEEISTEKRRLHDQEMERQQRAEQARHQLQERLSTGQTDVISAYREAIPIETGLEQRGYRKFGNKWLSPNSESGTPGVSVKDGKAFSHHSSDAGIGQSAPGGGTYFDSWDLCVHYDFGGDFKRAIRTIGDQFTTTDPVNGDAVTINKLNQRQYMREQDQASAVVDFQEYQAGAQPPETVWPEQNQKQSKPQAQVITLSEIMTRNPQFIPLILGLLNMSEGLLIHAVGGLGKSMWALYIAIWIAMTNPEPLFGMFPTTRRITSMFIQTENSAATFNARIRKMVGNNPAMLRALDYITLPVINDDVLSRAYPFSDPGFQEWLKSAVHQAHEKMGVPVDIVWVDPLISFTSGDENDSAKMRQELDALNEICRVCGVTPVVIHHDNRNGDYRGSSAIFDWCRGMIGLKGQTIASDRITDIIGNSEMHRTAAVPCIRVTHEKANNMKKFAHFLVRMDHNLNFQRVDESMTPEELEQGLAVQKALTDLGGVAESRNQLSKVYCELSGVSKTAAGNHIKKAVDGQFVIMESTLKNGNHAYRYVLPKA